VSDHPGLSREFRQVAQSQPAEAARIFCDVIETGDRAHCLFPLELIRIRVFTPLRRLREFAGWAERWRDLLLEAIHHGAGKSIKHQRLLFDLALYLNDRQTAAQVSDAYLQGFDLDRAFPAMPTLPVSHDPVPAAGLDWGAPLPNRVQGRPRVLLHVDGDGAFLPSVVPGLSCGEALAEMLREFDFPVTVSFIARDILLDQIENRGHTWQKIRKAFDHPQFEIASHGFIHPMRWQEEQFDLAREICGASEFLERECQTKVRVFLYTGDSVLNRGQLDQVEQAGLLGVNGPAQYQRPLVFPVEDWFHFRAAGFSDYQGEDQARQTLAAFERIVRGELDYPLSLHLHHYCQFAADRVELLREELQWLRRQASELHFDTLSQYYGEVRRNLLRI
jgi:hypothetical protein